MNSSQLELYSADPVVNYTMPLSIDGEDILWNSNIRKREYLEVSTTGQGNEMLVISQPPGQPLGQDYIFDATAGMGSKIYMLDTGCDPTHLVFSEHNLNDQANWIFPAMGEYYPEGGGPPQPYITNSLGDYSGHGTYMASKAAGIGVGVATKSQ